MDANTAHLDDPQPPDENLTLEHLEGAGQCIGDHPMGVASESHDHEAGVVPRRIALNIGEIQIERDQRAPFTLAGLDEAGIRGTTERLLERRVRFVTCRDELSRKSRREVLVELEFHAAVDTTRSRASSAA